MEMSDALISKRKQELGQEGAHLAVNRDIEQTIPETIEIVFNPNIMGNARIMGHMSGEIPDDLETPGTLDPRMDAYIQTQMAEEAAAELAKDQDRKPIVKN